MIRRFMVGMLVAAIAGNAWALELNRYLTDNMVIQRDKPTVIRGTAEKGAEVKVTFAGQEKKGKADDNGNWSVTLDPLPANTQGQTLTAASTIGNRKSAIENVLVGDVILHARQTNIDISLGRDEAGRKAASAQKRNPLFRAVSVKAIPSAQPLNNLAADAAAGWTVVDKDVALKMTASAYYLGRDLAAGTDVPVGIVDINLGSAFVNGWLSREALLETERLYGDREVASQALNYEKELEAEEKGLPFGKAKTPPQNTLQAPLFPAGGFNGTLSPLAGIGFKAVVLQLGNDYPYLPYERLLASANPFDGKALDSAYAETYDLRKVGFRMEGKVVPRVTREWRKALGDVDLPFGLIVPPGSDLSPLAQHHREMRELQRLVAMDNPNVGIILPGTEHIPLSAQPADDVQLAKRCLAWVEGAVCNKPGVPATGPLFDRFDASFNEATIYFKEGTAKGLNAAGRGLDFFEAANVEGEYYPVEAAIDSEVIRIKSDKVMRIVRIRYNWSEKPNQELVNAAGLPAIPFRSERAAYHWFVRNESEDLPEEYFLPANQWKKSDVTLFNGQLEGGNYGNFSGWIGPAGFLAGPFGPNMGVREIKAGSPADGKLVAGDVIYSANGRMLGEKAWEVMADAVTASETREGKGKLVLGLRRGTKNMDVELTLEVMGTYSTTAPYDCPKTEKIVDNLVKWLESGKSKDTRKPDFLGTDTLFLLATGNPELMGYVRREIYQKMAATSIPAKIDPAAGGGKANWFSAWDSLLLGEYYMATGDRNVLPYLKFHCDSLVARQHPLGAWRHGYGGADHYGLMPALGLAGTIGFSLANAAGLDISQEAYRKAVRYHHDGSGEMGRIIYGVGAGNRASPAELDPDQLANGTMHVANGALGAAAVLFSLEGKTKAAHLCSFISAHAWNNTFEGHGGNFWNNFWTPLGAKVHGKKTFIDFWKKYRWYRELGRNFDGSFNFDGYKDLAGYGLPLVAPRQRLQILGAPVSPFATKAPAILKPALDAYWKKDYAGCAKLVKELIAGGSVGLAEVPTVESLAQAAADMQAGIEADLARMQKLMDAGDLYGAKAFLPGLEGVMAAGDARLTAMQKALADVKAPPKPKAATQAVSAEKPREWFCLVTDRQFADPPDGDRKRHLTLVNRKWKRKTPEDASTLKQASRWKIQVVESMNQAPKGWSDVKFDDSAWLETDLPTSWRMYHTALMRTTFNVEDKSRFDALRVDAWVVRQQNMEIYLNGELIGIVNGIGEVATISNEFKPEALKYLNNGQNTLAIKTRHNWRWGYREMLVYNGGFDFNLDARLKEDRSR